MAVQFPAQPVTASLIGWLIALLVLIVVIILAVIGQMDMRTALLIGGLALARLL